MELDLRAIRALSSQARINILRELLGGEATPAELGETTGISADQLVLHLETLQNAGLIDTRSDPESMQEIYEPTDKAVSIVSGRKQKVRFSLSAATLGMILGTGVIGWQLLPSQPSGAALESAIDSTSSPETAESMFADPLIAGLGILLVLIAGLIGYYGIILQRLNSSQET